MNTIQQRNGALYVVIQADIGKFEWWLTIERVVPFECAYGNHIGEEIIPADVVGRWLSLDGARRYQLAGNEPEFVEGIDVVEAERPKLATKELPELIHNKEITSDFQKDEF